MIVSIAQMRVSHSLEENLQTALSFIQEAADAKTDLLIFPELWNTPFINEEILRHQDDYRALFPALSNAARENRLWIIAGTIPVRKKDGKLYNTSLVMDPEGRLVASADKLHLLEVHTGKHDYYEADVFRPGNRLCRFDTPWGKVGIAICFDTRFCEIPRLLGEDCFLLAMVCGFNEAAGRKHWQPLMQTRAMENEVFVAAANPAAEKYDSYTSYGHSMIVSPDGQILAGLEGESALLSAEIDPEAVAKIRRRSPFWEVRRTDLFSLIEKADEKTGPDPALDLDDLIESDSDSCS